MECLKLVDTFRGTNSHVEKFWTKMGFKETGERKPYTQGKIVSEYILFEKALS